MNHEAPVIAPITEIQSEALPLELDSIQPPPALTMEQAHALNTVMAEHQESDMVANLMGLWTGAMVLRDLAVDHFAREGKGLEDTEDGEKEKEA